jgi:hypothetical protein
MTRSCLALVPWLALACSSPTAPRPDSPLRVSAKGAAVRLENASARPVFYLVYERGAAAVINWAACVDPACPAVAPGGRAAVPYPAIGGYAPGKREAIVWWWEAVAGPAGAPVPGAVHAVVVGL